MAVMIEMDMPESCLVCPFDGYMLESKQLGRKCYAYGESYGREDYKETRAPYCPLKPIVSCKYCEHYIPEMEEPYGVCGKVNGDVLVTIKDYCSYGAKRKGEKD